MYAKWVEKNRKVVLVAIYCKMEIVLVNKSKKKDQHACLKKMAKCIKQAGKTSNLKYQEAHEVVWKLVQKQGKSGQPIAKI
jgi:hypothetical protein